MVMSPYEPYTYGYESMDASGLFAGAAGFVLVFLVIFYLIMLAVCITFYVLQALGLYTVAKRRGINHPWLAWVPVGNLWLLGTISDQYQYVAKGRVRNRRKVLLGLIIGMFGVLILACGLAVGAVIGMSDMLSGAMLALVVICYIAYVVLAIVVTVFQYIAYYDLFASCDPGNAVLYLVLSIVFNITLPFFVFSCRKKDLGMPSKPAPQPQLVEEPAEETVEETAEEAVEETTEE